MINCVLSLNNVTVTQGKKMLLSNLSGLLTTHQFTAIIGENGCGKSTLLSQITGVNNAADNIYMLGKPLIEWSSSSLATHRAVMQQTPKTPFAFMTDEVLLMGRSRYNESLVHRMSWLEQVADWLVLSDLLGRNIQSLSGGERQRIFLGKAIMQLFSVHAPVSSEPDLRGKLLLLDEPTSALDFRFQRLVMQQLHRLCDLGLSILCVSHDINLISPYCQQMWILGLNQCLAQGTPTQVITPNILRQCYSTDIELIARPGKPAMVVH